MSFLLFPLALAMIIGGTAAVYFGAPIITTERGWAMVISGSVAGSAGALLLGLAVVIGRLGRIERALATSRSEPACPSVVETPPMPQADAVASATASSSATASVSAAKVPPEPVVGSYSAGVNSYEMYADGSIRAMTPDGEHRFVSMEEFRAFVKLGGGAASKPSAGAA